MISSKLTCSAGTLLLGLLTPSAQGEARKMFDEKLSQWEIYIGVPHKTVTIPGQPASTSENGTKGTPLGLNNDPLKIFTTSQVDGETQLDISGEIYGALSSKEEFSNYHLSVQFKWGEKKWEPRLEKRRDSGILIHCTGEHGKFWNVWMSSLECQVQEHDIGDFIGLAGPKAEIRLSNDPEKKNTFDPNGESQLTGAYINASVEADKPNGEWNTIDIYTLGADSIFVVNGQANMVLQNAQHQGKPLTKGKIQIQSEAAACNYRGLTITPITAFPEKLQGLLKK